MTTASNEGEQVEIRCGGVALCARRLGAGPLVLIVHGGPGLDHHLLIPLARRLATRREVLLPDLPGHGGSALSGMTPPTLGELLGAFGRWLAAFPRPIDAAVGHSLGAWILADLARRGRLRCGSLVLISPPAGSEGRATTPVRADALSPRGRRRAGGDGAARLRDELVQLVADETGHEPAEDFRALLDRTRLISPRRYGPLLRQLHRRLLAPPPSWRAGSRVLVVSGERDTVTPPTQAEAVARSIAGARRLALPGCGHFPDADGSTALADAVQRFLDGDGV